MQETSVSNPQEPQEGGGNAGLWAAMFKWAGALASIALFVGIALWTYKLGLRDAMDVPIIQAMAGPAKVAPEDPGGKIVPHQGLAVNEVLAGNASSENGTVKTAPGAASLSDEDKPRARLASLERAAKPAHRPVFKKAPAREEQKRVARAEARVENVADPLASEPKEPQIALPNLENSGPFEVSMETVVVEPVRRKRPSSSAKGPAQVLKAQTLDTAPIRAPEPPAEVAQKPEPAVEEEKPAKGLNVEQALAELQADQEASAGEEIKIAALRQEAEPVSKFAPESLLSPKPRKRRQVAAKPTKPEQTQVATRETRDNSVKPGTRMVQLGAYGSEAVAKRQWDLIVRSNPDLLGAKQRYIQRTRSNGKTFYRLRATSFDSLEASRAACSVLSARGVPCIPTIHN